MNQEKFNGQVLEWTEELAGLEAKIDTLDTNGLKRYIELSKIREEENKKKLLSNAMKGVAAAIMTRNFSHGYGKELLDEIKKDSTLQDKPIDEGEVIKILEKNSQEKEENKK